MENSIFREKSIELASSPEQLNDYVKVTNPGVWLVLAAVIVLLVGVCVWGFFGHFDTIIPAAAVAKDGTVTCYISKDDISAVESGQTVRIDDEEYTIASVSSSPIAVTAELGEYTLYVGSLAVGEWVYEATLESALPDGVYEAELIVDSVTPMSFVLN